MKYEEIELLDLDGIATEEEVTESIRKATGLPDEDNSIKIRCLRSTYGGTLRAAVILKGTDATKLGKT